MALSNFDFYVIEKALSKDTESICIMFEHYGRTSEVVAFCNSKGYDILSIYREYLEDLEEENDPVMTEAEEEAQWQRQLEAEQLMDDECDCDDEIDTLSFEDNNIRARSKEMILDLDMDSIFTNDNGYRWSIGDMPIGFSLRGSYENINDASMEQNGIFDEVYSVIANVEDEMDFSLTKIVNDVKIKRNKKKKRNKNKRKNLKLNAEELTVIEDDEDITELYKRRLRGGKNNVNHNDDKSENNNNNCGYNEIGESSKGELTLKENVGVTTGDPALTDGVVTRSRSKSEQRPVCNKEQVETAIAEVYLDTKREMLNVLSDYMYIATKHLVKRRKDYLIARGVPGKMIKVKEVGNGNLLYLEGPSRIVSRFKKLFTNRKPPDR